MRRSNGALVSPSDMCNVYDTFFVARWETFSSNSIKHPTTDICQSCFDHRKSQSEDEKTSHHIPEEPPRSAKKPWTLTHGFYAQMGGFVLDTTGAFPSVLPPDRSVLTFDTFRHIFEVSKQARRPSAVSYDYSTTVASSVTSNSGPPAGDTAQEPSSNIAGEPISGDQEDLNSSHTTQSSYSTSYLGGGSGDSIDLSVTNLSEQDIMDKSKADGLAKTLVCVQALWFCAQCISRVAQRLPITLLELNAFAHSLCALLVYLLWWHKPLAIERATSLQIRNPDWIQLWAKLRYTNFIPAAWQPSRRKGSIQDLLTGLKLEESTASDPACPYDEVELPR